MSAASDFVCCVGVNSRAQSWDSSGGLEGEDECCEDKGEKEKGKIGLDYPLLGVACCGD